MTLLDQGNAHVIDWYLWQVLKATGPLLDSGLATPKRQWFTLDDLRFDPEDWSRYDGELL